MALTQEQILQVRKEIGMPESGETDAYNPAENTARRRLLAEDYDAKNKPQPNYLQRVGQSYMQGAENIISGVKEGVKQFTDTGNLLRGVKTVGLRTAGEVAKQAFTPIVEAPGIKQGLELAGAGISKIPGATWIAQKAQEFSKTNPELSKDLMNLIDIATLGVGKVASKPIEKGLKESVVKGAEKASLNLKAGIEGVMVPATKVGEYVVERTPKLLGIFSGESNDTIQAALRNTKVADLGLEQGDVALRNAVAEASNNSLKVRNNFIKAHSLAKQQIMGNYTKTLIPKPSIIGDFNKLLKENKVVINSDGTLDFTISKIKANPGEVGKIQAAYDALKKWDKFTIDSLDEYKQLVGSLTRFATEAGIPSKSPFLGKFYNNLNEIAYSRLPKIVAEKYKTLNSKFSSNIEMYDDMVDAFNSGDPFTKLAGALGKNKDSFRQIIEFYEKQSGQDILPIVAGREIAMEKQAAFGFLNPRSWIDFFISPKLQGKIILKSGEVLKQSPRK